MLEKLTVINVVTASYVVPWHLRNTLLRISSDFNSIVVGQNVSSNKREFPGIRFIDVDISRKTRYFSDILALFALCKYFWIYKPDIVHSIMPKAGLLAAIAGFLCRVPVRVHTFTGQVWVGRSGLFRYTYWMLDRLINRLNTVCLTDSYSQSEFLRHNGISNAGQPLLVLGEGSLTGVDTFRFNEMRLRGPARGLRANLGIGQKDFIFSFIARKTRAKGAIDILTAFSRVIAVEPQARLLFVGPDEDGEVVHLRNDRSELFCGVIEVGQVDNPELYLALTDVLCLPSYREGFGSIVIDAASMGVPAIGSRIPGLIDAIVDGETGMLFSEGDMDHFVDLMVCFIRNPQLHKTMGCNARQRAKDFFSADVLYAALKDFYLVSASMGRKNEP